MINALLRTRRAAAALVAVTPLLAAAQAPAVTALNAQLVTIGGGQTFAQSAPGKWVKDGWEPFTESQRNDTSIVLKPASAAGSYGATHEPMLLDFTSKTITNQARTVVYGTIANAAHLSGLTVSYLELGIYGSAGQLLMTTRLAEVSTNGTPTHWTATPSTGAAASTIALSGVTRRPASISIRASANEQPVNVDVAAGTCTISAEFRCRVLRALPVNGGNVGSMTVRLRGQLGTLTQVHSSGVWRLEGDGANSADYQEAGRGATTIDLVGGRQPVRIRFHLDGSGKTEAAAVGSTTFVNNDAMTVVNASPTWRGQLATVLQPMTANTSPGFMIRNSTDFPVLVSLEQVGCLYYEVVQPGQIFLRHTGAVWFTIKASMTPGVQEPTVESCVLKSVAFAAIAIVSGTLIAATGGTAASMIVPMIMFTAFGNGMAIYAEHEVLASGGSTTEATAARVGVIALTRGTSLVGMQMISGTSPNLATVAAFNDAIATAPMKAAQVGYSALSARLATQADIDEVNGQLTQDAYYTGAYAGYPWPWTMADRVMPQFEITGGPRVARTPEGEPFIMKQANALKITRIN